MKKLIFLFSFVLMAGMASAQCTKNASKKCCAKKAAATTGITEAGNMTNLTSDTASAADMIADTDENIEKRVCAKSGSTSFYQKAVCEKSGKVSWNEVSFCDKSQAFKPVAMVDEDSPIKPLEAVEKVRPTGATQGGTK